MTAPTITLKNVKRAAFASHETDCFEATVYVDGRRFCHVRNDGRGGPNCYDSLDPQRESNAKLYDRIAEVGGLINPQAAKDWATLQATEGELPPFDEIDWNDRMLNSPHATRHDAFDWTVGAALERAISLKAMKSALSKRWIFRKAGEAGLFEIKRQRGQRINEVGPAIERRHPGAVVLNALSFDEAFTIWQEFHS